jgi:hypothetical protein
MDFHLSLLKRISPGKLAERNQFVSYMTKVKNFRGTFRFEKEIIRFSLLIVLIVMMEFN